MLVNRRRAGYLTKPADVLVLNTSSRLALRSRLNRLEKLKTAPQAPVEASVKGSWSLVARKVYKTRLTYWKIYNVFWTSLLKK
jgi:hypothetical protein